MAVESGAADVVVPKFDMHRHESKITRKDVKLLARKYNIPLDFHPCAPTEGWTMDELSEDHIGLYEQFFEFYGLRVPFSTLLLGVIKHFRKDQFLFIDQRAIPDDMAWRHHDSDVYDAFHDNDFSTQDVQSLTEMVIDLRPVPSGLLFGARLATTWEFPGYLPVFKDTKGNGNICYSCRCSYRPDYA
ncbi:hypothetical protein Tco_0269810 [Tanacetum coccineum]